MTLEEYALKVNTLIKEKQERAKQFVNTTTEAVFCCNLMDELMDELKELNELIDEINELDESINEIN